MRFKYVFQIEDGVTITREHDFIYTIEKEVLESAKKIASKNNWKLRFQKYIQTILFCWSNLLLAE
jgi:DNA replication protein DnaD